MTSTAADTAASAAAIEAVGLSRAFGQTQVVRDATLSVYPGEITALIGPNGSGKTTLMLMLATLLAPDSGTVTIGGHDASTETLAARAKLGWMPDALGSWPTLSVRESLVAVCGMYGIRGEAATQRTEELLELTSLTELAEQRSNTLSRGQKQRLSLARAIAHSPEVLLLDEPAAGLDPEARIAQRAILKQLAQQGVAILVTSHVLDELDEVATRVVFLREGRTEEQSTVDAALAQGRIWRVRAQDHVALLNTLAYWGVAYAPEQSLVGPAATVEVFDEDAAATLLTSLVTAGVRVVEFAPASGALEQAFVRLASGSAAAPGSVAPGIEEAS